MISNLGESLDRIFKEAREKAEESGIKKGVEKGITLVANNLLAKGMPMEEIAEVTGLQINELQKLKKDSEQL